MQAIMTTGKERVRLRLRIEARGTDGDGCEFLHNGSTVEIHREGALVELPATAGRIVPGQSLVVRRQHGEDGWVEANARVLGLAGAQGDVRLYSVELLPGEEEFWAIDFPGQARSKES